MNKLKKIGVLGSIASLVALGMSFIPNETSQQEQNGNTNIVISGDFSGTFISSGNTVTQENKGTIHSKPSLSISELPIRQSLKEEKIDKENRKTFSDSISGWSITGKELYVVRIDRKTYKSKEPSFSIEGRNTANKSDIGGLSQFIAAEEYRNKKIKISGVIKREVADYIQIGLQAGGKIENGLYKEYKYTKVDFSKQKKPASIWEEFELVMLIPNFTNQIALTLHLKGKGKVWFDDLNFQVVDNSVPEKYDFISTSEKKEKIINLP